jgi:hypothetical protein
MITYVETPEQAAARIFQAETEAKAREAALQQEIADARKQEAGNPMGGKPKTGQKS